MWVISLGIFNVDTLLRKETIISFFFIYSSMFFHQVFNEFHKFIGIYIELKYGFGMHITVVCLFILIFFFLYFLFFYFCVCVSVFYRSFLFQIDRKNKNKIIISRSIFFIWDERFLVFLFNYFTFFLLFFNKFWGKSN